MVATHSLCPNWYKLFYNFSFNTFFFQFTGSSTSSTVSRQNSETPNFTDNSSRRTIQTPSPSVTFKTHIRARPKSFAQKFRPNSRLAGYSSGGLRFIYRTRAFISRGLYIFLPHFQRPFMYCDLWPYVWLVFKSGF